jgi:hypothetical protein
MAWRYLEFAHTPSLTGGALILFLSPWGRERF